MVNKFIDNLRLVHEVSSVWQATIFTTFFIPSLIVTVEAIRKVQFILFTLVFVDFVPIRVTNAILLLFVEARLISVVENSSYLP